MGECVEEHVLLLLLRYRSSLSPFLIWIANE